ncbi:MAG: RagB/SusD family nutrient uptake outer membrane protein [Prolixibacteraceae bacterium]
MKSKILHKKSLASKAKSIGRWFAGFFLLSYLLTTGSCQSYFEKAPGVDVTQDTIFSTYDRAKLFVLGLYDKVPDGYFYSWADAETQRIMGTMLAACSEQAESGYGAAGSQSYNIGAVSSFDAEALQEAKWQTRWPFIYRACWFIDNADNIKTATPNQRSELKAEARFIKAMHYFEFMIRFGGLPWLTHKLDYATDDYKTIPRLPLAQMVDSIDNLLVKTLAETGLPASRPDQEFGRVTRATVLFLRARLWIFAARPLFNAAKPYMDMADPKTNNLICMGNYDVTRWQKAADAAKATIDFCEANGYQLYTDATNPSLAYQKATRDALGNKELILVPSRRGWGIKTLFPTYESPFVTQAGVADGNNVLPTQNLVDRYLMKNGKAQDDPTSGFDPNNPYVNLDPRFYATIAQNGSKWNTRTVETWNNRTGGSTVGVDFGFHRRDLATSRTGYLLRKYCDEILSNGSANSTAIYPYMRLSDAYLMYAEALNEAQGPQPDCFTNINKVRARAGMPNVSGISSKDALRDIIIRERDVEFALEDIHYFDIKHLKLGNLLGLPIYGVDIRKKSDGTFTYAREKVEDRYWKDNWYLWPIPYNDMIRSQALVQNPGW